MRTDDEATDKDRVSRLAGGYNRTARDFDRALHLARLSSSQLLLVQCAREESWSRPQIEGKSEPEPFRLNISEIAAVARLDRSTLSKQHSGLVARKVFIDLGDGSNLINKDYRSWRDLDGSPLLTPGQIDHCKRIRRKVRAVGSTPQSAGPGCGLNPTVRLSGPVGLTPHTPRLKPTGSYNRTVGSTPQSGPGPIEERAGARSPAHAELNSESKRESIKTAAPFLPHTNAPGRGGDRTGSDEGSDERGRLIAWAVARIGQAYPGDDSIVEQFPIWVPAWLRDGSSPEEIQSATVDAIGAGVRARSLVSYIKSCLDTARRKARSAPPRAVPGDAPEALSRTEARRRALLDGFRTMEDADGPT